MSKQMSKVEFYKVNQAANSIQEVADKCKAAGYELSVESVSTKRSGVKKWAEENNLPWKEFPKGKGGGRKVDGKLSDDEVLKMLTEVAEMRGVDVEVLLQERDAVLAKKEAAKLAKQSEDKQEENAQGEAATGETASGAKVETAAAGEPVAV